MSKNNPVSVYKKPTEAPKSYGAGVKLGSKRAFCACGGKLATLRGQHLEILVVCKKCGSQTALSIFPAVEVGP